MTAATTAVLADIGIGPIHIPTPGDLVTALKNAVVDVADTVFTKITEWIAGLLADAVSKVTEALVALLRTVKPSLSPGGAINGAVPIQQSVLGLAAALLVVFYLFRIIHGLLTGQVGQNLRATLVDLPMVVVGTLFFGFLCYTLLTLIDAFSDPMIDGFATTLNDTVKALYSQDGLVKGGLFVFIFALLYIAAAIFLCFELFVRSSLIYLVVMFAPLAIATRVWGPTRSYARKATETAVALIFSKLAIAVTLATGASLLNGAVTDGGTVEMIQGSAILLLAAFMPFALLRVIPVMEGAVAGEGIGRGMAAKAVGAGYAATKAASAVATPVASATGAIRSQWESRTSASGAATESGTGRDGSNGAPGSGPNPESGGGGSGGSPNPASARASAPTTRSGGGPDPDSPQTRTSISRDSGADPGETASGFGSSPAGPTTPDRQDGTSASTRNAASEEAVPSKASSPTPASPPTASTRSTAALAPTERGASRQAQVPARPGSTEDTPRPVGPATQSPGTVRFGPRPATNSTPVAAGPAAQTVSPAAAPKRPGTRRVSSEKPAPAPSPSGGDQ